MLKLSQLLFRHYRPHRRGYSTNPLNLAKIRNIGILAHIDAGQLIILRGDDTLHHTYFARKNYHYRADAFLCG